MTKYYYQKDRFRCGPTAIMNTLRWAGCPYPYKDFKHELDDDTGVLDDGTKGATMGNFCDSLFKWARYSELFMVEDICMRPTLKDVDRVLNKGHAAVLHHSWIYNNHWSLIIRKTDHYYFIANHFDPCYRPRSPVNQISRKTLSQDLRYDREMTLFFEVSKLCD